MSRFRRQLRSVGGFNGKLSAQKRGNPGAKTARRNPIVKDKGCYWLICIPIEPDKIGWAWKGLIWVKGRDHEFTHVYKRTIPDIEAHAAEIMNCGDGA